MHAGSLGASIALHVLMIGVFVLPFGKGGARPAPPMPKEAQVMLMELAKIQEAAPKAAAPKPVAVKAQGTVNPPSKKKAPKKPEVKPQPKPKPQQVASKPTPKPTPKPQALPTPDPLAAKIAELRKHPYFKDWPEEKLRNLQLPPGMKSWDELAKMTAQLDGLDWKGPPPNLGKKDASAGEGFGFGLPGLFSTADGFGFKGREQTPDGKWQLAYQELSVMFVARWGEGESTAKVFYYPFGGKADPAKTFDIAVDADDNAMVAAMNINHQLIQMGQAPLPVPSASLQ